MFFEKWQAEALVGKWFKVVQKFHHDVPTRCLGRAEQIEETACGFKIVIAFYYANFSFGISPHDHALNRREVLRHLEETMETYEPTFQFCTMVI